MSDDLLRIARQMLAELEASEAYLRTVAIEALPYPKVMAAERRAGRRCAELLAGLGGNTFEFATVDDATDELLTGVVRPREGNVRPAIVPGQIDTNRGPLAAAESVGAYEPLDDGPEGAADDGNDLHSEEEPPRVQAADADTAELAARAERVTPSPGFVTFEDSFPSRPKPAEHDDEPTISAKWVDPGKGGKRKLVSDEPFDNLVTFEDPVSATPETVVRTHGPTPNTAPRRDGASRFAEPAPKAAAQSLVTIDDKASDLGHDGPETFDLIPDLSEDDFAGFEDEEVVRTGDAGSWDKVNGAGAKKPNVPSAVARKDPGDWVSALAEPARGGKDRPAEVARAKPASTAVPAPAPAPTPAAKVTQAPPPSPTKVPAASTAPSRPETAVTSPGRSTAPSKPPVSVPTPKTAVGGGPSRAAPPPAAAVAPATRPPEPVKAPPPPASSVAVPTRQPTPGKAPTPASRAPTPGPTPSAPTPTSRAPATAAPASVATAASSPAGKPQPARAAVTTAPASVPTGKPQPGLLPKANAAGKATPQPTAAGGSASSRVTAGLYGGGSVPTIRDSDEPRPRAAAIQLNASGSGARVIGIEEEEEPIEIGEAEDDDDDMDMGGGGFSVKLQRYEDAEDDDDEELELNEEDLEVIQPAQVIPAGPTPDEVRGMLQRAVSAAAAGDLQGGADLYSDVIDADPDNVMAHVARGRLFLDLGDYSRAMSDFMVGEDIAPNDPEPQVAIGDLYFARKDYRKAIDYFNAALEVSPNHAMAYCRRGISHYYRKNYKEAVDDLLKAERLDREIPNIQTYVSMARKKVKR